MCASLRRERPGGRPLEHRAVWLTLATTEAAVDLTDGALGAAGALLVAGAALLVASAAGLRMRGHRDAPGHVH